MVNLSSIAVVPGTSYQVPGTRYQEGCKKVANTCCKNVAKRYQIVQHRDIILFTKQDIVLFRTKTPFVC